MRAVMRAVQRGVGCFGVPFHWAGLSFGDVGGYKMSKASLLPGRL